MFLHVLLAKKVYYYKRDAKKRQENEVTYQEAQAQPHESTDK